MEPNKWLEENALKKKRKNLSRFSFPNESSRRRNYLQKDEGTFLEMEARSKIVRAIDWPFFEMMKRNVKFQEGHWRIRRIFWEKVMKSSCKKKITRKVGVQVGKAESAAIALDRRIRWRITWSTCAVSMAADWFEKEKDNRENEGNIDIDTVDHWVGSRADRFLVDWRLFFMIYWIPIESLAIKLDGNWISFIINSATEFDYMVGIFFPLR